MRESMRLTAIAVLLALEIALASSLYFPAKVLNVTLPSWKKLPRPVPPLLRIHLEPEEDEASLTIVKETTSGLFSLEGNRMRLNEESRISSDDSVSKRQTVVVTAAPKAPDIANVTVNLFLTGDKLNCDKSERHLCFWNGASFILGNGEYGGSGGKILGEFSPEFYRNACPGHEVEYAIVKGAEYLEARKTRDGSWVLATKSHPGPGTAIRLVANCTVKTATGRSNSFLKEFNVAVAGGKSEGQIFRDFQAKASFSNTIRQGERIATWKVEDPSGTLKFFLANDTEANFNLACSSATGSSLECEITTRKSIDLMSPYSAVIVAEDTSAESQNRFHRKTITLASRNSEPSALAHSKNPGDNFTVNLRYPESVEVASKAVFGARVAEPTLGSAPVGTDTRRAVVKSSVKFQMLTFAPGFNVTEMGGIVYVANRNLIKETTYRIKITGVYPNGYRFFSTIQINMTDATSKSEACDKSGNESSRPSCSEKRSKQDCEKTCGVSSGVLRRSEDEMTPATTGCVWRSNENPERLSRLYQTCSPDLSTCPDRFCDPLEMLLPKICPQDCTEYVFGSANKENHTPGIASATGVCTCDGRQKCLCALASNAEPVKMNERKKTKGIVNETIESRHLEAISAVKASYIDQCGTICLVSIFATGLLLVSGIFFILLIIYRRRLKKRCPNQRPLKEDMVNINYEEYVEGPGDVIRPLTQATAIKEIPEYYDKKWDFPRHRLTIEETIGEGEFGKVLKARADGIGGFEGSVTVAVKTLKDNAKDSELSDLISEFQLLKEIDHPNVIHLLGACTKLDGPVYIIIEYAKHGSLRNYLRSHRPKTATEVAAKGNAENGAVSPKDILTFAWQIAKGMNYLTDMKLVHRDLAARNVLVAEGLICKISDFGLARDIYEDDTYLKRSKGRVPVKWMAPESLADHIYTTKSDVWSYGVVLWELVTTGAGPYPGIAGQNLFHLLKSGYRMERPPNCSHELYQILRSCWQDNPAHRPTFKTLVAKFEEMLGEGKDYLDLNPRTVENKTYFSEFLTDEPDETTDIRVFPANGKPTAAEADDGIFKVKFELFEKPPLKSQQVCNKCPFEKCQCGVTIRYENESFPAKGKYENDGMEDTGYVQPTGEPRLVNSRNDSPKSQ